MISRQDESLTASPAAVVRDPVLFVVGNSKRTCSATGTVVRGTPSRTRSQPVLLEIPSRGTTDSLHPGPGDWGWPRTTAPGAFGSRTSAQLRLKSGTRIVNFYWPWLVASFTTQQISFFSGGGCAASSACGGFIHILSFSCYNVLLFHPDATAAECFAGRTVFCTTRQGNDGQKK